MHCSFKIQSVYNRIERLQFRKALDLQAYTQITSKNQEQSPSSTGFLQKNKTLDFIFKE